ncbi:MAG: hypothetical protein PHT07_04340 [Paludibacter sp.]|nr:hypothetical protein [Paludibacter sp.]
MKYHNSIFKIIFAVVIFSPVLLVSCHKDVTKSLKHNLNNKKNVAKILNDSVVNDLILFSNVDDLENKDDTTYISLLVEMYDAVHNIHSSKLVIIGNFIDNKYTAFEDIECESLKDLKKSRSYDIFKRNRNFAIFQNGQHIADYNIIGATFESFSCSTLATGIANKKTDGAHFQKSNSVLGYSGFSNKKKIEVTFKNYIALSNFPNKATHKQADILKFKPDSKQLDTLRAMISRGYLDSLGLKTVKNKDFKISVRAISSRKDTCLIVNYHHDTDSFCISSIHVIRKMNNKFTDILTLNNKNEIDAWGAGYELFDVMDIDGDGNNELIFEVGYYESTGFEIYKLENDQFKQVLSVIPWGC